MSSEQKKLHDEILEKVREYHDKFHLEKNNKEFVEGDRISYSGRVYDADEMTTLVDAALEFWLTQGRYSEEFEKKAMEELKKARQHIEKLIQDNTREWVYSPLETEA